MSSPPLLYFFFFFNDTATTEIYTLSLHDALPISEVFRPSPRQSDLIIIAGRVSQKMAPVIRQLWEQMPEDRKSTRLNSSHLVISYAVFCLKNKKQKPSLLTGCRRQRDRAQCFYPS